MSVGQDANVMNANTYRRTDKVVGSYEARSIVDSDIELLSMLMNR